MGAAFPQEGMALLALCHWSRIVPETRSLRMPGLSGVVAQDWLVTAMGQRALVWVLPLNSQVAAC